jgi:broad specificity phosphatase PhoE
MVEPISIHFVRHGDVDNPEPEQLYYGRLKGFPLSETGRDQAQDVAFALRNQPIVCVFSSPLERTRETAEIIREQHNDLPLRISPLLNEVKTPFDGRPLKEVEARDWDLYTGSGPEYEQRSDVLSRARKFVAEMQQQYMGAHVVAVTHHAVIRFLTLWTMGKPLESKDLPRDRPAPGSITTFIYHTMAYDEVPRFEYLEP